MLRRERKVFFKISAVHVTNVKVSPCPSLCPLLGVFGHSDVDKPLGTFLRSFIHSSHQAGVEDRRMSKT